MLTIHAPKCNYKLTGNKSHYIDKSRYEQILQSQQPDLYAYISSAKTSLECLFAVEEMRKYKYYVTLAETLVTQKYAGLASRYGQKASPSVESVQSEPLARMLLPTLEVNAEGFKYGERFVSALQTSERDDGKSGVREDRSLGKHKDHRWKRDKCGRPSDFKNRKFSLFRGLETKNSSV